MGSGFSLGLSLNALGQSLASRKCKGLQILGLPIAITENCYFQHAFELQAFPILLHANPPRPWSCVDITVYLISSNTLKVLKWYSLRLLKEGFALISNQQILIELSVCVKPCDRSALPHSASPGAKCEAYKANRTVEDVTF